MTGSWRGWAVAALVVAVAGVGLAASQASAGSALRRSGQPDAEEVERVVPSPDASTGSCGVERWAVKTGTDADAGKITLQSTTSTTIASLDAIPAPATLPASSRLGPTETTVFRVSATLTQYKLEADSDYHLVLTDSMRRIRPRSIPRCCGSRLRRCGRAPGRRVSGGSAPSV